MLWAVFAVVAGLTYCVQTEMNKNYKIDGFALNTFRALFSVLLLLPVIPFMEWPDLPAYYLVVILEAAISIVCMTAQYNLAAKRSGRVACLHQPIALMLTFVFWLMLEEDQRQFLLQNPLNAAGIAFAFLLFMFSIQFIRKNDAGWSALLAVIPIAVLYAIMTVVSKVALQNGETLLEISLNFVFLCNVLMFLMSFPLYYTQKYFKRVATADMLKISGVAFFHTVSWVFACVAIILTPNPAYVGVITGLAPIWFMLYYKFKGIQDDASPWAGLCMALAAIIIMLAAR